MAAAEPLSCFSETYEEARAKFLDAAAALSAETHSLVVTQDASGKRYTTDIAVVRGRGPGLVVVSSGTHGVEGYAGSAVQVRVMSRLREAPAAPTVVLVHAVNPHGMAHFRRWNENNVDLNRNALSPEQFRRLVSEDRCEATYMKFDHVFNTREAPGLFYSYVGLWLTIARLILQHGLLSLKQALVAATYRQSRGVFFGGQELQPSLALLRDFVAGHFKHVRARDVAWMDVHTGLGPCGVDVLLGAGQDQHEMAQLFPRVPGECDGSQCLGGRATDAVIEDRCTRAPEAKGGSVTQAAGYELSVGVLARDEFLSPCFRPDSGRVLALSQEFGTRSNVLVARALMLENAGYHYDRERHEYWRCFTRDAFYVRTADWKRRVLRRGLDAFERLVARTERVSSL